MKELTREELEGLIRASEIEEDMVYMFVGRPVDRLVRQLSTQLLAELDKPKVWDGAPEDAVDAVVCFYTVKNTPKHARKKYIKDYTRTPHKSRARQIAEEYNERWQNSDISESVDIIEQAINQALAEKETGK